MLSDPTRLTTLRSEALASLRRSFLVVADEILTTIREELSPEPRTLQLQNAAKWRFVLAPDRVKSFSDWVQALATQKIVTPLGGDLPATAPYLESAYRRGALRAWRDAVQHLGDQSVAALDGPRLVAKLAGSVVPSGHVRLLYSRSYADLSGVTADMAGKLGSLFARSLIDNVPVSRVITAAKRIMGVSYSRAATIVRTELTAAYTSAQLDAFEEMGIGSVRVWAEWQTGGNPCPMCQPLNGVVLTISEARGLLPRHPNCKCAYRIVSSKQAAEKRQRRDRRLIRSAFNESIKAETRESTVAAAKTASRWAGARTIVSTKRRSD